MRKRARKEDQGKTASLAASGNYTTEKGREGTTGGKY